MASTRSGDIRAPLRHSMSDPVRQWVLRNGASGTVLHRGSRRACAFWKAAYAIAAARFGYPYAPRLERATSPRPWTVVDAMRALGGL